MILQCSFDLHFSDHKWGWASFHVFVGHLDVFFGEMSVCVFCPFLNWVICFFNVLDGRFMKTLLPVKIERSKNTLERKNEEFPSLEMLQARHQFICSYSVTGLARDRCVLSEVWAGPRYNSVHGLISPWTLESSKCHCSCLAVLDLRKEKKKKKKTNIL